ncbi:flagellar hook protein FlgE [Hyphomicrobium sp. CS1BSMeth3]|uniref:flagellar hook protein FlgE n=1 Tax=Hyphomicrobium sp. CS1BSMeth3 TaxID=1892844 RepID=UPI0009305251|nr:flagellar hook protein FlgE [Hyphomicrobium sp. CS1BSMeth3]
MSVYGLMRTGASGMNAQSNRLGTIADNIANASTVGYKRASTQFSSLLLNDTTTSYNSGGVETDVRYGISQQGVLAPSTSPFDMAIRGAGFMIVSAPDGSLALTRAGAFVPDGEGRLINSAGYTLMGYPLPENASGPPVINGTAGLVPVNVTAGGMRATPTTIGSIIANLPAMADDVLPANLPSTNAAGAVSTARSSVLVIGNLGEEIMLDVHFAKLSTGDWEMTVYDAAGRGPTGGFPYAGAALATTTLQFDGVGQLDPSSAQSLSVPIPGGATMVMDLASMTQTAGDYSVDLINTNGNAPSRVQSIEIDTDGRLYEVYENGSRFATYLIPLATVASPDRLTPKAGNIFLPSNNSGDLRVGIAGSAGFGDIRSGALESSTVDLATELADMIEAQRNYTANSRVFQTGSELMELVVNLKR